MGELRFPRARREVDDVFRGVLGVPAAACGNALRLNAAEVEALLLRQVQDELLSPEAVELTVHALRDELKRIQREASGRRSRSVVDSAADQRQRDELAKSGAVPAAAFQPSIDAAQARLDRLLADAERSVGRKADNLATVYPRAAQQCRRQVERLAQIRERLDDVEAVEARAMLADYFGGAIIVKPETTRAPC